MGRYPFNAKLGKVEAFHDSIEHLQKIQILSNGIEDRLNDMSMHLQVMNQTAEENWSVVNALTVAGIDAITNAHSGTIDLSSCDFKEA